MEIRIPELLVPAGGMEQLKAAVACGADAVYVGGVSFSARARASNFDEEELREEGYQEILKYGVCFFKKGCLIKKQER